MTYRRLAWTCVIAAVLGISLAPRSPSSEPENPARDPRTTRRSTADLQERLLIPRQASALGTIAAPILKAPEVLTQITAPPQAEEEPPLDVPPMGWISGHVVDGSGNPIGGAILHLTGPTGVQAHRIADDGEFHFAVAQGAWTVEAGLLDGDDEWRSIETTARITPGATATLAIEILLGNAAHAVQSDMQETIGVGWEVLRNDGPLRAGDVLIEVNGRLLTDMQPEAVRAALRERSGETLLATVLRADASGALQEVAVTLEAH